MLFVSPLIPGRGYSMVECGRLNGWDAGHKSDFLMPNPHLLTGFTHQIESYETGCCFMGYMCCFSLGIIIPQIQNDLCSVSYVAIAVYDAGTSYFFVFSPLQNHRR